MLLRISQPKRNNDRLATPMLEFEILARGLYHPDQLDITYDPSLHMPTTATIQEWMDTLWEQKLALAREKVIPLFDAPLFRFIDRKSTRLNSSHDQISYAV